MKKHNFKSGNQLSSRSVLIWRIIQALFWIVGVLILFFLIFYPTIGIHLFWNILIPIAPALLVVGVGVWRNVCPMASTSLLPRHLGISKRKKITTLLSGKFNLIAVIALFIIVPLRHAIFDSNGLATAILLLSLGLIALVLGLRYEWKSAWCSGLCPVHPVEKLYGLNNKLTLPNAHCKTCHRCVTPCPDSTGEIGPLASKKTIYNRISGFLMVAAFPGFIWGWFQVPNYHGISNFDQLFIIYLLPVIGLLISLVLYLVLKRFISKKTLTPVFAAAAVSCYYWFRIPALFGFGIYPGDGMLIDLTGILPEWTATLTVILTTLFFFWWLVIGKRNKISWVVRPIYADN
jgi:hypothetical protein